MILGVVSVLVIVVIASFIAIRVRCARRTMPTIDHAVIKITAGKAFGEECKSIRYDQESQVLTFDNL